MNDFSHEHASILSRRMERETISLSKSEFKKKANELSESAKNILRLRVGQHYSDELTKSGFQEVEVLELLLEREDKHLSVGCCRFRGHRPKLIAPFQTRPD